MGKITISTPLLFEQHPLASTSNQLKYIKFQVYFGKLAELMALDNAAK